MPTAISVENLSKVYRLGQIGTGTFTNDLKVWWARALGKPNPLLKFGQQDHSNRAGEGLRALCDVSFTVEQGEVLGIIERNGAGKSTLLKILSRVTTPTSDKIKVKGRVASLLDTVLIMNRPNKRPRKCLIFLSLLKYFLISRLH